MSHVDDVTRLESSLWRTFVCVIVEMGTSIKCVRASKSPVMGT